MIEALQRIRKALVAGVGAGVTAYVAANSDGVITTEEWITIGLGVVLAGYAVYRVRNKGLPGGSKLESGNRYNR